MLHGFKGVKKERKSYFHSQRYKLFLFKFCQMRFSLLITSLLFFASVTYGQRVKRYDLYVQDTIVNYSGKTKRAIAVNGQIPMPTLEFTQGDTAEIVVHNQLKESTSLHWHGVQLPNSEDGVPFLTQNPIMPGETYTYRFEVIQNGTYWYHSHSGFQQQVGMHGSLVFHKKEGDPAFRKGIDDLPTHSIALTEWSDLKPEQIQRLLAHGSDWFAIKKNSEQSYAEAIKEKHFWTKIKNEWKRMEAMDISDVYYDAFLTNGQKAFHLEQYTSGDKVRLRVSNAGGSSYFWLNYAGGKITVVANDGNDVEPIEVDRLLIGVSETYDIVVELPEDNKSYELLATAEDRSGSTSTFIGKGEKVEFPALPRLKYFEGMKMMNEMMKMNGDMHDMDMEMSLQQMDMNAVMYPEVRNGHHDHGSHDEDNDSHDDHGHHDDQEEHGSGEGDPHTLNYNMLKATENTAFKDTANIKEVHFELTGNMNRYVWSMDDKVLSESDKIPVKQGEILRITLYNNSMMRHPMHLHGFDFRLLNDYGEYSPLKNVVDIMPMETNVLEFEANREGDWFFHCHILYHMMAGMNRVFEVGDYQNPELTDKELAYKILQKESNAWHFSAENDFASNGNEGEASLQNTRWNIGADWHLGYKDTHGYEAQAVVGRYMDRMQWFMPFVGFEWRHRKISNSANGIKNLFGQKSTKDHRTAASIGVRYTLPFLVDLQTEVFHDGIVRLSLQRKDIAVSKHVRAGFMVNTDKEYMGELKYLFSRNLGIRTHYDNDMGFGVGLAITY